MGGREKVGRLPYDCQWLILPRICFSVCCYNGLSKETGDSHNYVTEEMELYHSI